MERRAPTVEIPTFSHGCCTALLCRLSLCATVQELGKLGMSCDRCICDCMDPVAQIHYGVGEQRLLSGVCDPVGEDSILL